MQIWVDADACPGKIKELLYRAAKRTQTKVTLVANQALRAPRSEFIDSIMVSSGMNVADRRIVDRRTTRWWPDHRGAIELHRQGSASVRKPA